MSLPFTYVFTIIVRLALHLTFCPHAIAAWVEYMAICLYVYISTIRSDPIRVAIASCALDTTIRTETMKRAGEPTLFSMETWFYDCIVAFGFACAFWLCFYFAHTHAHTPHTNIGFCVLFLLFLLFSCRNLINTYRINEILRSAFAFLPFCLSSVLSFSVVVPSTCYSFIFTPFVWFIFCRIWVNNNNKTKAIFA